MFFWNLPAQGAQSGGHPQYRGLSSPSGILEQDPLKHAVNSLFKGELIVLQTHVQLGKASRLGKKTEQQNQQWLQGDLVKSTKKCELELDQQG